MNIENVLHIELNNEEFETLSNAISLLHDVEKRLKDVDGYSYTTDLYHETRGSLLRIKNDGIIADSNEYQITKKNPAIELTEKEKADREKYISKLGEKLYKFAEDTENLYDPFNEDKPTLKEFTKGLYNYKETAYIMESLLQGMDNSDDDFPKYFDVMMDLIHHLEWNGLNIK